MEVSVGLVIGLFIFGIIILPIFLAFQVRKFGANWGKGKTLSALLTASSPFYICYVITFLLTGQEGLAWGFYLWPVIFVSIALSLAVGLLFRDRSRSGPSDSGV